jgi:tRNA 2-thiocytidine biosynthesis protein TtcA
VIRPLAYCEENDLAQWAEHRGFPIIPCDLCGSQENLQRQQVKRMLQEWEKKHPGRIESMFQALGNVAPSHLLDPKLYNFAGLKPTGEPPLAVVSPPLSRKDTP